MAPARPISWRRCPFWHRVVGCAAPKWPRSIVDPGPTAAPPIWAGPSLRPSRRGVLRIGTGRDRTVTERRIVRIDGEPVRGQAALSERLGVVWLTPSMDRIFLDGPSGRRQFLDRLVLGLDPAH